MDLRRERRRKDSTSYPTNPKTVCPSLGRGPHNGGPRMRRPLGFAGCPSGDRRTAGEMSSWRDQRLVSDYVTKLLAPLHEIERTIGGL
jgi:hypothetical protein